MQSTGTFTATGQSETIAMSKGGLIAMRFAGTATVAIELLMPSGAWATVETVTADYFKVWDAEGAIVRLNCTAYTDDVEFSINA